MSADAATSATVTPGPGYVAAADMPADSDAASGRRVLVVGGLAVAAGALAGLAWFAYRAHRAGALPWQQRAAARQPGGADGQTWVYDGGPVPTVDPGRAPQGESSDRPASPAGEAGNDAS